MSVSELEILLNTLERLHSIPGDPKIDIHDNYGPKIHSRYSNHDWSHLTDAEETYHWLIEWSNEYRNASGGIRGLIHGDPVFTNALITSTQQIRLIDPRGEVGGIRTLTGDIFYDLAKVFQSLTGYDEILLDMPRLIHSDLLDWFRQHIEAHFGRLAFKNLKMITASLYFTLIPFHDTARHAEFLELSRSLISQNR